MIPNIVDATVLASMNAELILKVSCMDSDVPLIKETISLQVVGLLLLVVLVVGSDYVNLLS